MLRLDKTDPIDRMLLQELSGDPVTIDVWEDAMYDLEDEPNCAEILAARGLCAEDVLRDAVQYRADFRSRLSRRGLPVDDRFAMCTNLYAQAQKEPSAELLYIYCEILCDPGFLLDRPYTPVDADDQAAYEEQTLLQYLDFCGDRDTLLQTLTDRKELARKFAELPKQRRSLQTADCDIERCRGIVECFAAQIPAKGDPDILLGNLSAYMQIARSSPVLRSIEPLFLFRLLTRHKSRMCSKPDLNVNLSTLWTPDTNKIDSDNGRNFKQYRLQLKLFAELCSLYQEDTGVDLPLCWYALDQITVLGDFYREQDAPAWMFIDEECPFPFILTVEEAVEDAIFSCFEDGYEANIFLQDGSVTYGKLHKFCSTRNPVLIRALNKISDYLSEHGVELGLALYQTDNAADLCRDVLEQSQITYQPKSSETALFLAAIHDGLRECQDWVAQYILAQTGHALLDEIVQLPECLYDIL